MKAHQGIQSLQPRSQSSNNVKRIKCMFTTQLTKKRKTWSDGILKVYYTGGGYQCSLIDTGKLRETSLTSRQLESIEVQKLKKNEEVELEFESHIVTVSAGISDYDAVAPPLKLPKFVPPSKYVVIPKTVEVPSTATRNVMPVQSGPYRVTADELDDIWDRDEVIPKQTTDENTHIQEEQTPTSWSYNHLSTRSDKNVPEHSIYNINNTTKEKVTGAKQLSLHAYMHDSSSTMLDASINPAKPVLSNNSCTGMNRPMSDSSLNKTQHQHFKQQQSLGTSSSGSGRASVDNIPTSTAERFKQPFLLPPQQQQQQSTSILINNPKYPSEQYPDNSDIHSKKQFIAPIASANDGPKSRDSDGGDTTVGAAYSTIISNSIWDDD